MASGVKVHDDCKNIFQEMKLGHKMRYVIFGLSKDLAEIQVHSKVDRTGTYDDFCAELKAAEDAQECRYALYDAEYTLANGQQKEKIVFFHWSPDSCKIKQKMVYSSSKDALKKALGTGIGAEIQANDSSDLAWDDVKERLLKSDRS